MNVTAVKERPILFSGEMVRAILDGRKTQTRRVIKPQPHAINWQYGDVEESDKHPGEWFQWFDGGDKTPSFTCPYGVPGDRLWVRERFSACENDIPAPPACFSATVVYHADSSERSIFVPSEEWRPWLEEPLSKSRPSIHMPRWASRIRLELTEVRAQPLQNIIPADVQAESCPYKYSGTAPEDAPDWNGWFSKLWDGINPKLGSTWADDPWAWALTFERIQ